MPQPKVIVCHVSALDGQYARHLLISLFACLAPHHNLALTVICGNLAIPAGKATILGAAFARLEDPHAAIAA